MIIQGLFLSLENRLPERNKVLWFPDTGYCLKEHQVIEELQSFQLVNSKSLKEQVV